MGLDLRPLVLIKNIKLSFLETTFVFVFYDLLFERPSYQCSADSMVFLVQCVRMCVLVCAFVCAITVHMTVSQSAFVSLIWR